MELRQLGATGVMIPEIGIGVWRYTGGIEPLRRGIESGATLIDTAEIYGTEEVVAAAINGLSSRVFVASKVSGHHLGYDDVMRAAEASLKRLNIPSIDLHQVHWPNSLFPIKDTMRAMETLADRKIISHIGVSNFSTAELREARSAMTHYPIVSNQVLYNLNRREIELDLLPYCQREGITVIAYTPLDNGRLARRSDYPYNPEGMKALEFVAGQTCKPLAQVALNWCTAHANVITIPKSNSAARIAENCGASGWRLSPDQLELLNAAFSRDEPDDD
jgi:diketogulonate reductase-like aldo/keto reductase